jgi:hypothetical protein
VGLVAFYNGPQSCGLTSKEACLISFRLAIFSYLPCIRTDFIQDKNAVDCLACSLSLVQHSRYCIFLFDEMINYGAAYSMGSVNFWAYHRRGHIYTYLFHQREALIPTCFH